MNRMLATVWLSGVASAAEGAGTGLRLHEENHIGELIRRDDGSIEYLKTFRLSDVQARRAHLLQQLGLVLLDFLLIVTL